MAETAAEQVLGYLRDPSVVASLGAAAALAAAYVVSQPKPSDCPVDPEQQSIELPGEDHARVSAIMGEKLIERYFEDVSTTHDAFLRGVRISGDQPCIGHRSSPDGPYQWLTYNEVLEASTDFGSGLIELGCGLSEDMYTFVGVYAPNKPEWVLIEQACGMYSFTIIPLYDTLGPDACVYIINQAKMMTAVCDEAKIPVLLQRCDQCPNLKNIIKIGQVTEEEKAKGQECGIRIVAFSDVQEMGKNHRHEKKLSKPENLAVICYTSGTTGNPKGAMITHANTISMASALICLVDKCGIKLDNNDVHISYLPLAHMYERLAQLMIFMCGGRVGFFGGNIRRIMEDLQELKPTLFISVPRVLNRVYDKVIKEVSSSTVKKFLFDLALSSKNAELKRNIVRRNSIWDYLVFHKIQNTLGGRVRFVISGSAPLRDDVMMFLRCALGCIVLEGYGQTETTAAASVQLIGDQTYGHVGPPLPCNKIKLVDVPEMECYAKDGKGEVCFYGPNVFKGYLYDPEKTREAFDEDGWLHSGDVAQWLPNGTLKIFDRKKHIFKLAQGEYIAPEKIETVYTQCDLVHQVYVHGDSKKACLVAVVVPEEGPLSKWTQMNGVEGDLKSLCDNEKVNEAILSQMISHGKRQGLHSFEQVKAIYLHEEIFSVENGLLTPTLKFKRPALKKQFLGTFEKLYSTLGE